MLLRFCQLDTLFKATCWLSLHLSELGPIHKLNAILSEHEQLTRINVEITDYCFGLNLLTYYFAG